MKKIIFLIMALFVSQVLANNKIMLPDGAALNILHNSKIIEYCPDNTCDQILVSKGITDEELSEISGLFFYYASGYIELDKPLLGKVPFRTSHRSNIESVLKKYNNQCHGDELETASCILFHLAKKWDLSIKFIRYDEGEKVILIENIKKKLSTDRLKSVAEWYQKQQTH